jgi:hypothetical protein
MRLSIPTLQVYISKCPLQYKWRPGALTVWYRRRGTQESSMQIGGGVAGAHRSLEILVLWRLILVWYLHVSADIVEHVDCKGVALVQLEAIDLLHHCLGLLQTAQELLLSLQPITSAGKCCCCHEGWVACSVSI